jgi:Sulfotransferase domain
MRALARGLGCAFRTTGHPNAEHGCGLASRQAVGMSALRVIGAGFGRTGTLSLKRALDELGFGPTYHMEEVVKHPSHITQWCRYASSGTAEWDELFSRYRSGVDFPVSCAWRELAACYPDAKIVLTVRDPDSWWASTSSTIFQARDMFPRWMRRAVPITGRYLDMNERLVWDGIFGGRFAERDHAIAVFERHVADVRAATPAERLLVFNVAEGWGPLCEFLEVAEPAHPFPRLNDATSMRRRIATVRLVSRVLPAVVVLAAAALVRVAGRRR